MLTSLRFFWGPALLLALTALARPAQAQDAAVLAVQTLTQLPIPAGAPHVVRAVVQNNGTTALANLPVTLTVAGANAFANTQTVAALAPGASATVSFAAFAPTATGTNTLTVAVPPDTNPANDSRSVTQVVNTSTYSYADPGGTTGGRGFFSTIVDRAFACRYTVNSPVAVTQVRSYIVNNGGLPSSDPASTIGKTVYGVVVDAGTGDLLARSADYVITAADINTYVALPLTTLVAVPAGRDMYVGMVQLYPTGQTVTYFPFGQQPDAPGRTGAFYNVPTTGGAGADIGVGIQGKFMMEAVTAPATVPAQDAAVLAVRTLTQLPIPAGAPHVVRAVVSNRGTAALANLPVTLTVGGANAFSNVQTVAALAPGASVTVSFAAFTPTATGTNTIAVNVPPDGNTANDSRSVTQVVNTTTYSYADPGGATGTASLGVAVDGAALACRYSVNSPLNVTQVRSYIINGGGGLSGPTSTIGKTVYGVVVDAATNALLARSADRVLTAADINTYVSLPLTTLVSVPAGTDLLVGMVQLTPPGQAVAYVPFGAQAVGPPRPGTFYALNTNALDPPTDLALLPNGQLRLMIEAVTAPAAPCPGPTSLTVAAVTATSATLTFTPPAGAGAYTLTYAANGGPPTTLTPAPTGSPVVLGGLSPATPYVVTLTSACGGGQTSLTAAVGFNTPQPAAPYATLPVNESFEGTWLSVAAVRDAPTNNWRNTPATGVRAWRRDDDGASAGWFNNLGAYAPAGSRGARSARFNSYNAPLAATGTLDLYVNLGAAGPKTLSFDYVNVDGNDRLDVLVSTDGGATFGATPVLTVGVSPAFTFRTVSLASTSATTVIRFRATSDFGDTDIGLDNVRLALVTGTRSEALAAQVGLYPNPARGGFTLAVPAGPLATASATLFNALGQAVQAQRLHLPAAGGMAGFDVRGLAAGVYTLQLLTGETLVVKRVVLE